MLVLSGCAWFVLTGGIGKTTNMAQHGFVTVMADAGFRLENIYVEGREYTDASLMMALINVEQGAPLLSVNPHQIHEALSAVSWIENLTVKRVMPDSLYIDIKERQPVALWLNNGKLHVLDRSGYQITTQNIERFKDFMIVQGKGAPRYVNDLFSLLESEPELQKYVDQAVLVGQRRWDLLLKNKITVNLPEKDMGLAVRRLMAAHQQEEVLDKKIKNIDIRQSDRLIIKAYPGSANKSYSLISAKGAPI